MFEIQSTYRTMTASWGNIVENFHVFHFDEYPILYAGTNNLGGKVIGSLASEENDIFRHFHFLVNNKQYNNFVKGKISYRDLILSLDNLFIIDKQVSGQIVDTYFLPLSEVPDDYLPAIGVFCPNIESALGLDYTVKLTGRLADMNEGLTSSIAKISKSTESILKNFADCIKMSDLRPNVYEFARSEGSFKINFRIKYTSNTLFESDKAIKNYFQNCLDYFINYLPNEVQKIVDGNYDGTIFNERLIPSIQKVFGSYHQNHNDNNYHNLASSIINSFDEIEKISDEIGNGFNGVEFLGFNEGYQEVSIGYIDKEFNNIIEHVSEVISSTVNENEETDDEYQEYRIQVYNLNTDTRKGTAHIMQTVESNIMDNPKIKIEGVIDLTNSKFTESLHLNQWIFVKAKARKVNGRFKNLNISLI